MEGPGCQVEALEPYRAGTFLMVVVDGCHRRSEPHLQAGVGRAAERRESKNLRVMFVRQVVDPAEDGKMRVDLVFGGKINERIIFDVEIRATEI
jgi:hypothetical protein